MKHKPQTPQRIRLVVDNGICTVYVSCRIASIVRHMCVRLQQQIMHPLKGQGENLHAALVELAKQYPNEFMTGSRILLIGRR